MLACVAAKTASRAFRHSSSRAGAFSMSEVPPARGEGVSGREGEGSDGGEALFKHMGDVMVYFFRSAFG